jgi:hypothetical protein
MAFMGGLASVTTAMPPLATESFRVDIGQPYAND